MIRTLLAATAALTLVAFAPAHAKDGVGVGKYKWNPTESHYETGAYATEQTMEITRNDKNGIAVSQVVSPIGGKTFSWNIDAPYDDKMRHASQWMSFAFSRISDNSFHDRYIMDADGEQGEETFVITDKKLTITGASMHKGEKKSYVEVWDRVD